MNSSPMAPMFVAADLIDTEGVEASAFSTSAVKEAAYAHIREKIISFEAILLYWKQRHNALSIVRRLPPELLTTIFRFVSAAETESTKFSWISVSHVCSQWRRVALDSPDLWSTIPFSNPPWAAEVIKRSKMAPLTIAVAFGDGPGAISPQKARAVESALTQVLAQLPRVKDLSLSQSGHWNHGMFTGLLTLLDNPAPLLERLQISFLDYGIEGNWLPSGLILGAPRLRHLHLSRCSMDWQQFPFSGLKTLIFLHTRNSKCPSVDQLLSGLTQLPSLEFLEFSSPFAITTDTYIPPNNITSLPHLRYLCIECDLENTVLLVDHLAYPTNTRIKLVCTAQELDEDSTIVLVRHLAEKVKSRVEGPIRSLEVQEHHIKCWGSPRVHLGNPQFPPTVEIGLESFSNLSQRLTKELWKPYASDQLSSLMVVNIDFGPKTWLNHFGKLSRLKKLRVGWNDVVLLDALSHGIPHTGPSAVSGRPGRTGNSRFKALRNLTLVEWVFDDFYDTVTSCVEKLAECLAGRRKAGLSLRLLELERCLHINEDDVGRLEEFVETVEWEKHDTESSLDESEMEDLDDEGFGSDHTGDSDMSD